MPILSPRLHTCQEGSTSSLSNSYFCCWLAFAFVTVLWSLFPFHGLQPPLSDAIHLGSTSPRAVLSNTGAVCHRGL